MVGLVTSTSDDQLVLPTPCPEARVGDLIDHVGVFAVRFLAAARKDTGDRSVPPPKPSLENLEFGWRQRISEDLAGTGRRLGRRRRVGRAHLRRGPRDAR